MVGQNILTTYDNNLRNSLLLTKYRTLDLVEAMHLFQDATLLFFMVIFVYTIIYEGYQY